jgi:hypothetical protein
MAVKSLSRSSLQASDATNSMLAGYSASDFELISTVVLASSSTAVYFTNLDLIASPYKHLQIRSTEYYSAGGYSTLLQFNGDSSANYSTHALYGQGSSINSSNNTTWNYMLMNTIAVGHTSDTNDRVVSVVDILDFNSNGKFKTVRALSGRPSGFIELLSGNWRNNAPVTSIALGINGPLTFSTGTRFSLYGRRG